MAVVAAPPTGIRWSPSDLEELAANYRHEISAEWVYRRLSELDAVPERSAKLRRLSEYERKHADAWAKLLRSAGGAPSHDGPPFQDRWLVGLARLLGVRTVLPFLHRQEVEGIRQYRQQAARWRSPEAQAVFAELLPDEVAHEIDTLEAAGGVAAGGGGSLRSVLLGAIDGFASIVALSAGVAGITESSHTVLIAGSASVVAGALSMAASEYVSVKAETDAREAQARMEREAAEAAPETKRRQLVEAYERKGLTPEEATTIANRFQKSPVQFVKALLEERFGYEEGEAPHPARNGVLTGAAFVVAGSLPLIPYLFLPAIPGTIVAVAVTGGALFVAGLFRALSSLQPFVRSGFEMLLIGLGASAGTYLIGLALGSFAGV